jgi:hypothetical protein
MVDNDINKGGKFVYVAQLVGGWFGWRVKWMRDWDCLIRFVIRAQQVMSWKIVSIVLAVKT